MSSKIVLYDLPSRELCKSWSLNPWKTRLALNYKGIDYETQWVEYPDLAPLFKSFAHLESEYGAPTYPPVHLDSPLLPRVEAIMVKIMKAIVPIVLPLTPNILNPPSAEFFERSMKQRFGKPLSEVAIDAEAAWANVDGPFGEMATLLNDTDGPYFMGDIRSYPDFHFVTFLHWCKRVDEKIFERAVSFNSSFREIYDAYEEYFRRDDY